MSLDARVIRQLRYMLPSGLRLEDRVLRRTYSAKTMSQEAYIVLGGDRWDGQRVLYPVQKMLHFLFPDQHPTVFHLMTDSSSARSGQDGQGSVVPIGMLPPEEQKHMLASFLTPKETEVAGFLQGLQAQLSFASTKEETRAVLDEFVRIVHLPAEVADVFYQRVHHHPVAEDFPEFPEQARKEIDREFCYEFGLELTQSAQAYSVRNETSRPFPPFELGASVIDALLLVGADVAYEAQKPKHERLEATQTWAGVYGKMIDPFDVSGGDPYGHLALGLRMLMLTSGDGRAPSERSREKARLLEAYKRMCADLAFGAPGFAFPKYQRDYAQLCYETGDREELEKVLELQLMNVERQIEDHGLRDQCGFRQELFDEPIDQHLIPLIESLFLTWHAHRAIEKTEQDNTFETRMDKIKRYLIDEVINARILKKDPDPGEEQVARAAIGMPLDVLLQFNPAVHLAKYMGEPEVDYAIAQAIVGRAHDEHDGSHLLLAILMGRYFPQFSPASKHLESRLEQASYPHTFLKSDELRHWQDRLRLLLMDNDFSREERIWQNSFLYHMIHYRTSAMLQSAEDIQTGDLVKAREQWEILGFDSPALWSIQALELLRTYETLTPTKKTNLVRSCAQFIGEEPEIMHETKGVLEKKIMRELKRGINFELFDMYMTTAARLRSHKVLLAGAQALRRRGQDLGQWFRLYWPLGSEQQLPDKLKKSIYEQARAGIEAGRYAESHQVFKKLDPAQGTQNFLVELYARQMAIVNEHTADSGNTNETQLEFTGDDSQLVTVMLRNDVLRGRGSEEVRRHTLTVESEKTRTEGRRSIVTKVNDDSTVTAIEYKVLESLKRSQFFVANPLSIVGAEITTEYSGIPLLDYAAAPGRDERKVAQYVEQATQQRLAISRALETILSADEKLFLGERQIDSMDRYFEGRVSRLDIVENTYAWRVMRALGFEDVGFVKSYMSTIGRMLTSLPGEYYGWLRDNFAGNCAIDGDSVVSFDFNNLTHDVLLFDDVMLLDSYGLQLSQEVKERCVELTRKVINPDTQDMFDGGYRVARVHRNLLQAGNILREIETRGKGSLEEADHYWQCSQESLAELRKQKLVGVDDNELAAVERMLKNVYEQRRAAISTGNSPNSPVATATPTAESA